MSAPPSSRLTLQPTLKASSTSQPSQLVATATRSAEDVQDRPRPVKPQQDVACEDATSEKPTISLIRHVLGQDSEHEKDARGTPQPVEEFLPPLTSSNELDVQLYAIIAIVVKDFVNTWYANITSDHAFVDEVVQVIAHCCRALEQRARHVDLVQLILDEIPSVLERHLNASRTARSVARTSPFPTNAIQIYSTLNPHPALSPVPNITLEDDPRVRKETERAYRQLLVQGVLAILLPTEDLQNACLRTLVGDIMSDLILGQAVATKSCESWFLHDAISKVILSSRSQIQPKASGQVLRDDTRGRLERFGLLSSRGLHDDNHSSKSNQSVPSVWFWSVLQYLYLAYLFIRYLITGIGQARSLPSRSHRQAASPTSHSGGHAASVFSSNPIQGPVCSRPVLAYRAIPMAASMLDLSTRMPWLQSLTIYFQHIAIDGKGRLASADSTFDKFLHETLRTQFLSPSLLPRLLRVARGSLFPNNTIGPPAPPAPTAEEKLQIRRKAAENILDLIPVLIARHFFATHNRNNMLVQIEEQILDVFGDAYMNKHLIYQILDLVIVRLVPEMAEKTPSELLAERGIGDEEEEGEEEVMEMDLKRPVVRKP